MRYTTIASIKIIEIDLGLTSLAYYNVFIVLLDYMQYKLAFTRHIDIAHDIAYCFVIY